MEVERPKCEGLCNRGMYVCVHVIYVCTFTYTHIHIHIYIYMYCISIYIHTHISIHVFLFVHIYIHIHLFIYKHSYELTKEDEGGSRAPGRMRHDQRMGPWLLLRA